MGKKHTQEYVESVINQRGGTLLSEYINNASPLLIQCNKCGNKWEAIFTNVAKKTWCPVCGKERAKKKQAHSYEFVREYIENKGGILLSKFYENERQKLKIICKKGHIFESKFGNIVHLNRWCNVCGGTKKLSLEIAKMEAEKRNGKCLSTEYVSSNLCKMLWQCNECGHIWESTLNNIRIHNKWCPKCSSGKTQKLLFSIISELFENKEIFYGYKNFDWLRTYKNGKQEFDIYVSFLKLAIEYDGEQHFKPIEAFGGEKGLERTKKLDSLKNKKVRDHPEDVKYFVRIPYWEEISEKNIKRILLENGINL